MEIFQHITSLLEPPDLTCLGLTCKAFWALTPETDIEAIRFRNPNWRRQRQELLQRLARDSLDMIACNFCVRLRPLHGGRTLTMSNQWLQPPCPHLAHHIKICQHFSVTREMLEIALKLQKSSAPKDVAAPDPLSHTCTWRTSGSGSSEIALSVASKVVAGGLLLRVCYDVDMKLEVGARFNTPCMTGKGCLHSGMWLKKRCMCALRHTAIGEAPCADCSRVQGCAYCFTQFLVSAKRNRASSLHLSVMAYRYLGKGQDGINMLDEAWLAQTRPPQTATRREFHVHSKDSSLRDIFEHRTRKPLETMNGMLMGCWKARADYLTCTGGHHDSWHSSSHHLPYGR
jgi:hypothetical protein